MSLPGDGGRIVLLNPDGTQRVLTEGFTVRPIRRCRSTASDLPSRRSALPEDLWNVYECSLDNGQVRQVTRDMGNCRQPGYQSQSVHAWIRRSLGSS